MTNELTKNRKKTIYYNLGARVNTAIKTHNDLSAKLFKSISSFSSLLPEHLTTLSRLSDMITDAIVVSGRSSLSKAPAEIAKESSGVLFNADTGDLTLDYRVDYTASIKNKKSYIQTDGTYNIFNPSKSSLASFSDLLDGNSILIESKTKNFRYTFCIEFSTILDINSLLIKLNKETDSYPLISEMYYINSENKREYITFLNTFDTKYDLDTNRVEGNEYNILFSNIKTNKIYVTFEDKDKTDLSFDTVSFRKLKYSASGSIVFGPIVSTYPILKASIEAAGDVEGASFYISHNKSDWVEVALPTEISKARTVNKIVAFNTISKDSIKVAKDVKEIYLKIELEQKAVDDESTNTVNKGSDFYASTLPFPVNDEPIQSSVYLVSNETFFGDKTFVNSVQTSSIREKEHNYILNNGKYLVKSFVSSTYGYDDSTSLNNILTSVMNLKVNGDSIDASVFDPLTSKTFGYSVNNVKKTCNVTLEENIVLHLKPEYSRDVYTIRQNNKELKIDLSLGFIDSSISAILGVEETGVVTLYDSTGRVLKELVIRDFDGFKYISLIEEELFDLPIKDSKEKVSFNTLYPIRLNEASEFGLLDGKLYCVNSLISFEEIYTLDKEEISTNLTISKENLNKLVISDSILKDKYTEKTSEVVEAYLESRAIKLKNKHIQKGSLRITQS